MFTSPAPEAILPVVQEPEPASGNGTPAAGETLTIEAIQTAVAAAMSPLQSQLDSANEQNERLQEQVNGLQNPNVPVTGEETDFYTRFAEDPKAAVTSIVSEVIRPLAPVLQNHNDAAHSAYLEGQRSTIDAEFGTGTFEQEFMPVLSKQFDNARKSDPSQLANQQYIANAVNSLKGFKFNELVDRRSENVTKTQETKDAELKSMTEHLLNTTGLSGGLRSAGVNTPREISAAEEEYLTLQARVGIVKDPKDFESAINTGNTLADYRAKLKKEAS
jgi:hypothetical protein